MRRKKARKRINRLERYTFCGNLLNLTFYTEKPRVELIAATFGTKAKLEPDALATFGALGCFEERAPTQIFRECAGSEEIDRKKRKLIDESFGRGHGSVADQNAFVFEIENLPRTATLQLCLPHYLAHLQQSLRRAHAGRGFLLPKEIAESGFADETIKTSENAFSLYERMGANGIPGEDARFILPLCTRTNIQTLGDARELTHLHAMNEQGEVPSTVKEVVELMIAEAKTIAPELFKRRAMNYETLGWYPSAQLYSSANETMNEIILAYNSPKITTLVFAKLNTGRVGKAVKERNETELANLKHVHNGKGLEGFLIYVSIAALHQTIRQRTWDHSIESIYDAAKRREHKIPPKIATSSSLQEYKDQNEKMFDLYEKLIREGIRRCEAIAVVPHSLMIYDLIHVNGWNAIHSIGKRTCTEAQWEIRAIAKEIAEILKQNDALKKVVGPQGKVYGKCPERKSCGVCDTDRTAEKR